MKRLYHKRRKGATFSLLVCALSEAKGMDKTMKKVLLCVIVCVGMCCTNALAVVNIEKNQAEYTVTADCKSGEKVTMIVGKTGGGLEDSTIVAIREGKSDGEKITFVFGLEEVQESEGKYTVYVRNNGSNLKTEKEFFYVLDSSIQSAAAALEGVNTLAELENLLNPDGEYLIALQAMGLNYDAYSARTDGDNGQKKKINDMVIAEKETANDLIKLINDAICVVMLNDGENAEDALLCAMPVFEDVKYEDADNSFKGWVKDLIKGRYSSTEEFNNRYIESAILYQFHTAKFSDFTQLFNTYDGDLGITGNEIFKKYNALSLENKSKVGEKLVGMLENNPAKTTTELLNMLKNACEKVAEQEGDDGVKFVDKPSPGIIIPGGTMDESYNLGSYETTDITYKDMADVSWAETAVTQLTDWGVISGDGDGNFRPNDTVTREEFAKMFIIAIGYYNESSTSTFDDVDKEAWYYKYISSAYEAGIVEGITDTEFGVGKGITRQEMAVMISRTLNIYKEISDIRGNVEFADKDDIAEWAKEDVDRLYRTGLMSGVENNRFEPTKIATRAQAAVVVYNLIK